MILSTPHPPQHLSIALTDPGLLTVKPGTHIEDALIAAADYLQCAAATAYEVADNQSPEFRPLARSVVNQLDMARVLIEATLEMLSQPASVAGKD